jgi:hypothetical protein
VRAQLQPLRALAPTSPLPAPLPPVASTIARVAPGADIVLIDVFQGTSTLAYDSDIIKAIDWVVSQKAAGKYNFCAINLSVGDGSKHTQPCAASLYEKAFASAQAAGILPAVAAGAQRKAQREACTWAGGWAGKRARGLRLARPAFSPSQRQRSQRRCRLPLAIDPPCRAPGNDYMPNALPSPACAPSAVSVGAVHDSDHGAFDSCDKVMGLIVGWQAAPTQRSETGAECS